MIIRYARTYHPCGFDSPSKLFEDPHFVGYMSVPCRDGNHKCKITACRITDRVERFKTIFDVDEIHRLEYLCDYLRDIGFRSKRIVDVDDRDTCFYRQMHAKILIEFFKTVNEGSAVNQNETFLCTDASERSIYIKLQGLIPFLVNYVRFSFAVRRKDLVLEPGRVEVRAILYEELPLFFDFVSD